MGAILESAGNETYVVCGNVCPEDIIPLLEFTL